MGDNKLYTIIIIILGVMVLGLGGFIAVDKFLLNKEEENMVTTIDDVKIDLNALFQVEDILNILDRAYNYQDSSFFGAIYNAKSIEASQFSKDAAIFTAAREFFIESNTQQVMYEAKIKYNFERIFGKNRTYEAQNVNAGNYQMIYDQQSGAYVYTAQNTTNGYSPCYLAKNYKVDFLEDGIAVTRKIFYVEYANNSATIYKDASKQNALGILSLKNGGLNLKEVMSKYSSKIKSFKYTFKLNKIIIAFTKLNK